jgi:voltage-gated potassium channel
MLTAIPLLGATFALMTGAAAAAGIRRLLSMKVDFPSGSYRLVVGMHPSVPAIVDELLKAGDQVVLVADVDPSAVAEGVHVVQGDPTDDGTIRKAKPANAQHALVVAADDTDVLVSAVLLHEQAPDLPIAALTSSRPVAEALRAIGVEQTVSVDNLVAHTLAKSLESPHAGDLLLELVDSPKHKLEELKVESDAVGQKVSAVRCRDHTLVLGIVHAGKVDLALRDDPILAEGDRLLVARPTSDAEKSDYEAKRVLK